MLTSELFKRVGFDLSVLSILVYGFVVLDDETWTELGSEEQFMTEEEGMEGLPPVIYTTRLPLDIRRVTKTSSCKFFVSLTGQKGTTITQQVCLRQR